MALTLKELEDQMNEWLDEVRDDPVALEARIAVLNEIGRSLFNVPTLGDTRDRDGQS